MSKHGQNHTVFDVIVGPTFRAKENKDIFSQSTWVYLSQVLVPLAHGLSVLVVGLKLEKLGPIFGNQCFKLC